MGYCPIVLQKEMKLYCNTVIVLQRRRLEGWKFYCNIADCIARMCSWLGGIVLQEGQLYCNRGSLAAEGTVLQYSLVGGRFVLQYKLYCEPGVGLCRDTARARQLGMLGAAGARTGGSGPAEGALACSTGAQQAQAALAWGAGQGAGSAAGRTGHAAGGARVEACEARAERD